MASMRVACSIAHRAVRALRFPASANGSICERRAEMTANSAATKKALPTSNSTSHPMPKTSLIERLGMPRGRSHPAESATQRHDGSIRQARRQHAHPRHPPQHTHRTHPPPPPHPTGPPLTRRRGVPRLKPHGINAPSVKPLHTQRPLSKRYVIADHRQSPQVRHDEPGNRLVIVVFWNPDARALEQLIRPQDARKTHRIPPAHNTRPGAIMLVSDLADQLLHEIFQRGNSRRAAILVHDNRQLIAASAEFTEQRIELDRFWNPNRIGLQG